MPENDKNNGGFFGSLWDTVSGFFSAGFEKVWTSYWDKQSNIFIRMYTAVQEQIQSVTDKLWDVFTTFALLHGWIDEETKKDFDSLTELPLPFNVIAYVVVAVGILTNALKNMLLVTGADMRRSLFNKYEPNDAEPSSLLPAVLLDPDNTEAVRKVMKDIGLPKAQIDLYFQTLERVYDENNIRTLFLRGVLSEGDMIKRMKQLGYTDQTISELVQAWPVIPGAGDLFHLVAKEAFEPDMITKYGYDEEFPVDQVKWLKMQGISEDWARKYWYAHWDTPSIGQGFEMLHRGVINDEELDDLFRTIEIPPFWRDKLTKIAFNPFTRVDVRRMHKSGVLGDDELINAYLDAGYNEDRAIKMAEFTILYNAGGETDLTRAQIITGFKDYILTKDEAIELMGLIHISTETAEFLILLEEYKRSLKLQTEQVKSSKRRYMLSLVTLGESRDKLNALDLPSKKIDVLLESWELEKYDNQKIPTKTELAKFMKSQIIDENTYRVEMHKLNYTDKYINWYLENIKKSSRKEVFNGN